MHWLQLAFAILFETVATSALKASDGFTRWGASLVCLVGYGASFYLLSQVLKVVPVGIAYAIWAGVGMVLITAVSVVLFNQRLDAAAVAGIVLIMAGVVVLNVYSSTTTH
jgi:small multidrug resistance pump